MNIALIGFGKMGHMLSSLIVPKHKLTAVVDPVAPEATHKSVSAEALKGTDVVIDFSHPSVVLANIKAVCEAKKNMVVGTTGWYEHVDEVKSLVKKSGIGFLYASNFSIGVQLFLKLVGRAGELFSNFNQYDVFVHEFHHSQKADSPSGTALSIGNALLDTMPRKKELFTETSHEKIAPDKLHITSTRGGSVPGTHEVFFDGDADTVELKHTARSRAGFAAGAVKAAEWLYGKKGFYTIEDYLDDVLK